MNSDRLTRRNALRLSGLALVGFAGCATRAADGPSADSDDGREQTPTATGREYTHSVETPVSRTVRNPDGLPAVVSIAHTPERDHLASGDLEPAPGWDHEYWFVTAPDERDAIEFPEAETTGVEAATEFIAETDLSESTLLIQQYRIQNCVMLEVDQIEWEAVGDGSDGAFAVRMDYDDTEVDGDCGHSAAHETHTSASDTNSATKTEIHAIISRIPIDIREVRSFEYGW